MVFGSRQMHSRLVTPRLTFVRRELVPEHSAKDLGVILDTKLTYDKHITKTVSSCMSCLSQISRTKCNVSKLQIIHNFAGRIVTRTRKYDHVTPVLKELKWLPVATKLSFRNAVMAFKCLASRVPEYLSSQKK